MSRWHESHCSTPDVSISDGMPQCNACSVRCPLQELISAQKKHPPLSFPPNEPRGDMNLWWPRSVLYTDSKGRESSLQSLTLTSPNSNLDEDLSDSDSQPLEHDQNRVEIEKDPAELSHLPVYGPTLGADEFRLVCLSAAGNDEQNTVHVSLETYNQANCPEYETVSYTWGGENGDYTLCHPIFVGVYWDVSFQSKNCWDMMQFLRPWRGIRMVWIDALCINQSNVEERGAQVAKMGQIYEGCSRVVVYLGPDIASSSLDYFPSRILLHDMVRSGIQPVMPGGCQLEQVDLRELLKRKYFSRVWVIQELIFSQRAIIRVGDMDFYADSTTSSHIEANKRTPWDWSTTAAPWLQYMAHKGFPSHNLYEVLRLTSQSLASDPRDKLFGILGLIQHNSLQSQATWKPDYSLSAQHVFIGLIAHFIINLKKYHLLHYAVGLAAPATSPSWMPDWSSPDAWQRIFTLAKSDREEEARYLSRYVPVDPGYHIDRIANGYGCHFSPAWTETIYSKWPWDRDMSVDCKTGALYINLIHLSTISTQSTILEKHGDQCILELKGLKSYLYIVTNTVPDAVDYPGVDHLYMLKSKDHEEKYLVLRKLNGSGDFKLIASSSTLFLAQSGWKVLHIDSLYNEIVKARSWLDKDMSDAVSTRASIRHLVGFFPGLRKFRDFMPAYRSFINDDPHSEFETAYISCIDRKYRPRIVDDCLELSFLFSTFAAVQLQYRETPFPCPTSTLSPTPSEIYYSIGFMKQIYDWDQDSEVEIASLAASSSSSSSMWLPNPWKWQKWKSTKSSDLLGPYSGIHLTVSMDVVRTIFELVLRPILRIQRALRGSFDDVETLLQAAPKEEHHFIGSTSLELGCDLDLDVSVQQVRIS